ncbi:MAG: pyruvate:ferredoxin (flavodoxin) oxidoreductase [Eubacteriaceae bacterium]|nr:pyruvate:ferredoxin (flavodoxin) oxidoreductase [Eubacteriaceae bacterium]
MSKKMKTMDGNNAAAYTAYAFTEVAAIYPITPSSTMAEVVDEWSANGQKNIFGQKVDVVEMQSEGGAAGAVHGSLSAGALTTTFTASQGLLLMIPNMYKIAGELLPGVFHVSARAIAGHALSIFGDHSDVMAARQTGFALLASNSVQEAMDLGGVAHLSAIKSSIPFVHFFDGFRTSHEIQNIELIDYSDFAKLLDEGALKRFRSKSLSPERPFTKGTAQNPDIFFQEKEASNRYYENIDDVVSEYMSEIGKLTGRQYKPFQYYGDPEAENIIVAMGSVCEAIEETIDYLQAKGERLGLVKVHLYRPFSKKYFFEAVPKSVRRIAVLDRTKEPGAAAEPLCLDVRSVYHGVDSAPAVVGGRYGLGSKDTTPSQIKAVFDMLSGELKDSFTIGIVDDVTNLSLPVTESIDASPEGTVSCKFWGLGSDGTVGANKSAIKIIGDYSGLYAQGYFDYDSKKSGGLTSSHLRFGRTPIRSTYLIDRADFVSCSMPSYLKQYDMISDLKKGGIFLLNTNWSPEELEENMPNDCKRQIAEKGISFYTIDATGVASEVGLGRKTNMIMEAAFFKLSGVIPYEDAERYLKDEVVKSYGKKGDKIVAMNYAGIDKAVASLNRVSIPSEWANAKDMPKQEPDVPEFIEKVLRPMVRKKGDSLPVSTFVDMADGIFPAGTAAYEKRNIASAVPEWKSENCIQCAQCSFVCPHASIRPFLLTESEVDGSPIKIMAKKANGKTLEPYRFRIQVSPRDCTGCGSCINVCPAKEKALVAHSIDEADSDAKIWDYLSGLPVKNAGQNRFTVKGSQLRQPLLEFSGACEGCGETPYAKLLTQLFGDHMFIANATGCSSIWGASAPSIPYTKNALGKGPAWANSLFEDNAEYGYGIALSVKKQRNDLREKVEEIASAGGSAASAAKAWLEAFDSEEESQPASQALLNAIEKTAAPTGLESVFQYVLENREHLAKKIVWLFGGDGWAYDIGYGGLDHVLASGEDLNVLVFDTEVYSNTGGQSSKSTPTAAVAKFAAQGKRVKKKDLGMMAAAYGYVYVAQVSISDMNQLLKAVKEAASYNGPSLIIAYAPCINHGIKSGMGTSVQQAKNAVECGYWHHYRFNPSLEKEGKNPFSLDSKEPTGSFMDFIKTETRYTALEVTFPDIAKELFAISALDAKGRFEKYKKMAEKA